MERYDLMGTPYASGDRAGILRTANAVDEKNSGCTDAATTPSNLYNLLDFRKANTAYTAGEIVACPYHKEFLLKCTTGGTTGANSIDTTAVTKGSAITDGSVVWTVIASQIIDIDISGTVITVTFIDGTQKTLTTQDTNTINYPNYSAGVSKSYGTQYTAETDGYLYVQVHSYGGSNSFGQATINGKALPQIYSQDWGANMVFYPLKKDDTYKVAMTGITSGSYDFVTFYPVR